LRKQAEHIENLTAEIEALKNEHRKEIEEIREQTGKNIQELEEMYETDKKASRSQIAQITQECEEKL
jgi:mevalonate kinase